MYPPIGACRARRLQRSCRRIRRRGDSESARLGASWRGRGCNRRAAVPTAVCRVTPRSRDRACYHFPLMSVGVPFGNYRLQRRLARGGMAEVFLARLIGVEGFERRVAIKRILPHLSESEEFRAMFLDEARLAAQLTHPNIVHIYDFGKVEDYYFIAMEYVDGIDIGRLIRRAKDHPVPFELAARILADTCAGLDFAHHAVDAVG